MKILTYIPPTLVLALLTALFSAPVARAQDDPSADLMLQARDIGIEERLLNKLNDRAKGNAISPQTLEAIVRSATELARGNLPYEMIFEKAFEGLAMRVSSERIETAVAEIHESTRTAADVVDRWARNNAHSPIGTGNSEASRKGLTVAISNVIRNDVHSAAAGEILTTLSEASLPSDIGPAEIYAAIRIIPEISAFSDNTGDAAKFMTRAIKGGFKAGELQRLPSTLKIAQARNQPFVTAVLEAKTGLMQGLPASQVLQNLMNGHIPAGPPGSIPVGLDIPAGDLDIPGM